MQRSRRALLHSLSLTLAGLAFGAAAGCGVVGGPPRPGGPDDAGSAPSISTPQPDRSGAPAAGQFADGPTPAPTTISESDPPIVPSAPGTLPTVAVPPTPTPAPPTPIPTPRPRPRPTRALVTVPYYSQ